MHLRHVARAVSLALAAVLLPVAHLAPASGHEGEGAATLDVRETTPFTMVGATWEGAAPTRLRVSTRAGGAWSPWQELEHLEDGPADAERDGSHLLWVGPEVQTAVRVEQTGGSAPVDLVLLDTSEVAEQVTVGLAAKNQNKNQNKKNNRKARGMPRPKVRPRKQWGANEKWHDGTRVLNKQVKQIHIHHTASGNGYRRKDVPGIIQGFYRYHTKSLGWSDIGYNVLVDRFGRAWVGRRGGLAKRTRGAHTLGFNHASTGIAVIGTYTNRAPSQKSVRMVARLAAWQLDRHDSPARGKVQVRSTGSTRFKKGRKVRLPIIDGHRHTNHTLCPGQKLFDRLPQIRRIAQRRINQF